MVRGLARCPQHNGRRGTVVGVVASGHEVARYNVRMHDGSVLAVRPANLDAVDTQSEAWLVASACALAALLGASAEVQAAVRNVTAWAMEHQGI